MQFHLSYFRKDSQMIYAAVGGGAFASGTGPRRFESQPQHSNGVTMVPVATLLGAQHYKTRTGFSSLIIIAQLTSYKL